MFVIRINEEQRRFSAQNYIGRANGFHLGSERHKRLLFRRLRLNGKGWKWEKCQRRHEETASQSFQLTYDRPHSLFNPGPTDYPTPWRRPNGPF